MREYLVRHLPASLRVTRGFICSTDEATRISPEIDVLITDQESELPWFAEGGLVIAPPTAVCGQIHVKTEFGTSEIIDVLESMFNACVSCEPQRDPCEVWAGAIFFAHSDCETAEACSKRFSTTLSNYLKNNSDERRRKYLPDCIAIVDGPVITFEKRRAVGAEVAVAGMRMFKCDKLSVAILLSHFYDSLIERGRSLRKRGEWTQILQQKSYTLILHETLDKKTT